MSGHVGDARLGPLAFRDVLVRRDPAALLERLMLDADDATVAQLARERLGKPGFDDRQALPHERLEILAFGGLIEDLVGRDTTSVLVGDVQAASAKMRHDLRTPIAAILGYGDLLAEEDDIGPEEH